MTPGEFAALRSVGLLAGTPLVSSAVLLLPLVADRVGIAAPSAPTRLPTRVDQVARCRRRLLDDLRDQAEAGGAVGLVGIALSQRPLDLPSPNGRQGDVVELTATAIPVTARTRHRPTRCFRTAIDPAGVGVLLRSGWVPVDVLVAGTTQSRSARHRSQDAAAAAGTSNREIPGPTDMIQRGRRVLRQQFEQAASALGGDGVLLHGDFEVTWTSTYHLVQVAATGNVIARFGRGWPNERPAPMLVLPSS